MDRPVRRGGGGAARGRRTAGRERAAAARRRGEDGRGRVHHGGGDPVSEPVIDCHVHVFDPGRFPYAAAAYYTAAQIDRLPRR